MGSIKLINIEMCPYYFSDDMINITKFDLNLLGTDKISFKRTDTVIYNIRYITMKSLDHENPHLIFNNANRYIKESNGYKYLIFDFTNKNKKVLKKYAELCDEIKDQIETINNSEPVKYKTDFMKIRFESYDDLPLGKILSIPSMIIVVKSVF